MLLLTQRPRLMCLVRQGPARHCSDDGVKVWLNGKLVHERWGDTSSTAGRGRRAGAARARPKPIAAQSPNASDGWGFTCRVMGARAQGDKLAEAVRHADRDAVGIGSIWE